MRIAAYGLTMALALAAAGCGDRGATDPASAEGERATRALAELEPHLTRDLTPSGARARLGEPDETTGSGLIIYKYRVDRGTLWLGFPGERPIAYARLVDRSGAAIDLPLR